MQRLDKTKKKGKVAVVDDISSVSIEAYTLVPLTFIFKSANWVNEEKHKQIYLTILIKWVRETN